MYWIHTLRYHCPTNLYFIDAVRTENSVQTYAIKTYLIRQTRDRQWSLMCQRITRESSNECHSTNRKPTVNLNETQICASRCTFLYTEKFELNKRCEASSSVVIVNCMPSTPRNIYIEVKPSHLDRSDLDAFRRIGWFLSELYSLWLHFLHS